MICSIALSTDTGRSNLTRQTSNAGTANHLFWRENDDHSAVKTVPASDRHSTADGHLRYQRQEVDCLTNPHPTLASITTDLCTFPGMYLFPGKTLILDLSHFKVTLATRYSVSSLTVLPCLPPYLVADEGEI